TGNSLKVVRVNAGETAFELATAGGGGTPGGSNTQVQYNNSGAFGGITNATSDGTTMTLTSPKIVTNIKDTNANTLMGITAQASYLTANDGGKTVSFAVDSSGFTSYGAAAANDALLYSNSNLTLMADFSGFIKLAGGATAPAESARVGLGFMVGTTTDPGAG